MAFSNSYSYRKLVTIDHAQVSGGSDLTNFPVLVSVTDARLKTVANGGAVQSSTGLDIRFETAGGTKLDHEVETWSATTGQIVAWVRIPTLAYAANTTFWLYYGNAAVSTSEENKTGVWDATHGAVYLCNDDPAGTAPQIKDSTAGANHLTVVAGPINDGGSTAVEAGITGSALGFYPVNQYTGKQATSANVSGMGAGLTTVSSWVKFHRFLSSDNGYDTLMGAWEPSYPRWHNTVQIAQNSGNTLRAILGQDGGPTTSVSAALLTGIWYRVALVRYATGVQLYVNGALSFDAAYPSGASSSQPDGYIHIGASGRSMDASYDQLVFASVARSAGWIATEYNSQSAPSTFTSFGTEDSGASSGVALTSGSAGEGEGASGTATLKDAATVTAGEGEGASGTATLKDAATGSAGEGESVAGAASLNDAATGAAGEGQGVSGTATLSQSATGTMGQGQSLSGATEGGANPATGTAGEGESVAGTARLTDVAAGSAGEGQGVHGTATLSQSATGAMGQGQSLSGVTTGGANTGHGTAGQGESVAGSATQSEIATGAVAQGESVAGTATQSESATGSAAQGESVSGVATESIDLSGSAGEGESMSGVATLHVLGEYTGALHGVITSRGLYAGTITARSMYAGTITARSMYAGTITSEP